MWAWIVKLISGWLPIGVNSDGQKKSFGEFAGKILWVVGIIVLCSLATNVWDKLFPSKPSVINVTGDYINEKPDVAMLGCSMFRGYIKAGIRR